jgi:crotonobetainyl-CoA:carnitine CoA-transferase CaiB-like acyl-CoA transferase
MNPKSEGPLSGLVVLDLSTTFMGPYCSLLLAQLGARVIKVEAPGGDIARYIGDDRGRGLGPIFLNANRGKESVVIDLGTVEGRHNLDELVDVCDVFLHNLRPKAAAKLKIRAHDVLGRNPHVVYCHTVGFGTNGPYRDRAAYDDVVQGVSGLASVQGGPGEPEYVRMALVDKTVGLMAMGAIAAGLFERSVSGKGQAIEIPMFESMVSFVLLEQQGQWVYEERSGPIGYSRTSSVFRKPYRTADGYISLLIYTDEQWRSFFRFLSRDDLLADERFLSISGRTRHIDELYELVELTLATDTTRAWVDEFAGMNIAAMPVLRIEDLFSDDHLMASHLFERNIHPTEGALVQTRLPWGFSRSGEGHVAGAPLLGEHTTDVFEEFGIGGS